MKAAVTNKMPNYNIREQTGYYTFNFCEKSKKILYLVKQLYNSVKIFT